MVVYDSFKNPLDVVFVIEATANLGAYIDVLKKHYIIPTLELFNGGPPDPTDYGHDYSCTLYNMVTFFSFDIHPDATARCSDITTNIHEFITWLDDVPFTGGGSDTSSYIAEGLSTALHVFDDLEQQRRVKGQQIQKHCILVCNSPPYQLPSMESLKYSGFMSEQLAKMMAQRGINLSIISPRKIPALLKLYEESTMPGDLGVPAKDFSTDPRHHILLHGYQLQERAHSPVNDVSEPAHSPAPGFAVPTSAFSPAPPPSFDDSQTLSGGFKVPSSAPTAPSSSYSTNQMPSPLSMSSSMPSPQQVTTQQGMIQQQNVGQQQGLQQNIGQQNLGHQQNIGQQQNMGQQSHQQQQLTQSQQFDQMMAQQQQQQQQQQMAQQNQQAQQQQVMSQHFGQSQQQPNVTSQPSSMNPIHSQGNLGNPQNVSLQQQVVSSQMGAISVGNINSTGMTQVGNQPGQPIYSNPQLVQNQGMPSAEFEGQQNQAAAQMKDRKIIWRGLLEWQEKVKPGGPQQPKVSRQLQCHLSIGHSDPDINASNWPSQLIMQFIPQSLLTSTQLQPRFKNSRQVAFHFGSHNLEALKNLYKVMGTGFAGCVHFPSPSQCDVRVLLLLFSNNRRAFIGLIPNDQTGFVQGMRTAIYSYKIEQQRQNMLKEATGTQMPASNVEFPGQQPNNQLNDNVHMFSWGKPFIFKSKPFDWNDTLYYHQLTEGFSFVPKYQDMTEVYEEFNTLAHVTNFESLQEIFEDGYIKHHYVKDSSVCNPDRVLYSLNGEKARVGLHPLARSKVVWYGPYTKERAKDQMEMVERYGNVMFTLDQLIGYEGILRGPSFNYYLVEVIHYKTQTATRILVTSKEYPNLNKYDPFVEGGPWYYDRKNDRHWCLTKAIHFTTKTEVKNTVEFMKDKPSSDFQMKIWLANHDLSHKVCYSPRKGVQLARNLDESFLRLVLGTVAYKLEQRHSVKTDDKMPSCIQFLELSADAYSKVRDVLGHFRLRCIANQDAHISISVAGNPSKEDDKDAVSVDDDSMDEDAQNGSDCMQDNPDGADTLLETMLRSKYGEIGDQLLKMKDILGTKASFQSVSPAKVADTLLIFFRQEFFKVQIPLEHTFEAIMRFLEPNGISAFFNVLETMIDDSMPREGREQTSHNTRFVMCHKEITLPDIF